jgi:hypothetical protein
VFETITRYTAALLGRSAYQAPPPTAAAYADLDSPEVLRMRRSMGGQLQLPTVPQTRWYLAQLEAAEFDADAGNLELAGKLMRSARMDGVFSGVLSTRTGGLVRLPKTFRGDPDVIDALELGHETAETRSVFDEMLPPSELAALAADGVTLGVGVAELVPVVGRDYPVMVRLEPHFLIYRWIENRWYFRSAAGLLPITPGDGRWILHTPGGRSAPWINGIWRAIARAYIRKEHANLHKDNWEAKLANPARVAVAPQGAAEAQAENWFKAVMAWGVNTVFGMRPGYDVKLVESNGRGYESWVKTIADQNNEMIIAVAGQTVTTDGGAGFANADIHKSIRADLIKATADDLAYTINTQAIPAFVASRFGEDAIDAKPCVVAWDVTPPKDKAAEANALVAAANAIKLLSEGLATQGMTLDVAAMAANFGVPVKGDRDGDGEAEQTEGLPVVEAEAQGTDEQPKAATALNGAQVTSLLEIIGQVAAEQLPRESALEIIVAAFGLDRATAEKMLGEVGLSFVPASSSVDVEDVEPEPDGDELESDMQEAA